MRRIPPLRWYEHVSVTNPPTFGQVYGFSKQTNRIKTQPEQKSQTLLCYYHIPNIGAFGENVFKIGMTRRLEPRERIDELGDASVPFTFDTHALIFSDNAPALESKIHAHFEKARLNKINNKKEFFRASIAEIHQVVREHYDKTVDFVEVAPAQQYRESLLQ